MNKNFVPILDGITPAELPEWVKDRQAVDLGNPQELHEFVNQIGAQIKSERGLATVAIIGLLLGFVFFCSKE
jgi:hypoxanthine-guanine phosphoribosyltransferase